MGKDLLKSPPAILWIILLGGTGFAVGFFGPIVLVPDANQGPLLGIFITGPLSAILGGLLFLCSKGFNWSARRQWQILKASCIVVASTTLIFAFPEPVRLGRIYHLQVQKCVQPTELESEIINFWNQRIEEVTWKKPRNGWQEEMKTILKNAPGIVVEASVTKVLAIRQDRKPWSSLKPYIYKETTGENSKRFYFSEKACDEFPAAKTLETFNGSNRKIEPPQDWPPKNIERILQTSELRPIPPEYQ